MRVSILNDIHKELESLCCLLTSQDFSRTERLEKAARGDRYTKIALQLNDLLLAQWSRASGAAIKEAVRTIIKGEGNITDEELKVILERLDKTLGISLAAGIESGINEKLLEVYEFSQKEVLGAAPTFNLTDERAINWLNRDLTFWVGQHYQSGVSDKIRALSQEVIRQGFGRMEAGNFFKEKFSEQFKRSHPYWELLANNSVTRGREFGRIEAYVKADVQYLKYVAVLDRRTSKICRMLHGTIFPVSHAVKVRNRLLNAKHPERVKKIAPWIKPEEISGKAAGKLRQSLSMPPLHGNCRSRTIVASVAEGINWEKQKLKTLSEIKD